MNLCIVGNGFDAAHGYRTKYSDFKIWMEEQLGSYSLSDIIPGLSETTIGHHGEELLDEDASVKLLMWLFTHNKKLDDRWNNFEESLYSLELKPVLEENSWFVDDNSRDREGDINPFKQGAYYRQIATDIQMCVRYTHVLFQRWIESVEIGETTRLPSIEKLATDSLFLSFNYTETLEQLYGVPSDHVCHIHGLRNSAYGRNRRVRAAEGTLIIGHGNDRPRAYGDINIEAADVFDDIIRELRKPTGRIIKDHSYFWDKIRASNVDEIYSYGFSYGDVDMPYIDHICKLLRGRDIVWYLHDRNKDEEKFRQKETKLRNCGFEGRIERFS